MTKTIYTFLFRYLTFVAVAFLLYGLFDLLTGQTFSLEASRPLTWLIIVFIADTKILKTWSLLKRILVAVVAGVIFATIFYGLALPPLTLSWPIFALFELMVVALAYLCFHLSRK